MERVVIEKLVFGGQGLGRIGNQVAFIWGGLPGEEVEINVTKKKKQFIEGVVSKIITPSPERVEPIESHYLSCSPWQTMGIKAENDWKVIIAKETYQRVGGLQFDDLTIVSDDEPFHYRNKIEYSFATTAEGKAIFAFHERGQYWAVHHLKNCALATHAINETAEKVLNWINTEGVPPDSIKNLVVRSNTKGETIAALFIKNKPKYLSFPERSGAWKGFHIYYSNPLSPAAVPTELLRTDGDIYLIETIQGTKLRYGLLSFFQVNVPIFEKTLDVMRQYTENAKEVVDYYAGVGSIGLSIAGKSQSLKLVENNAEAAMLAEENRVLNNLEHAEVHLMPAENETSFITSTATVIVDPPRAGLDKRMVRALLEAKPERILYLSCDLATQARDCKELVLEYTPIFSQLYNFFPRTPHIEGLIVLERKAIAKRP